METRRNLWKEIKRRLRDSKHKMNMSRPKWTAKDTKALLRDLRDKGRSKRWPATPEDLRDENIIFLLCFYARKNCTWEKWRNAVSPFREKSAATVLLGMLLGIRKNALLKFTSDIEPEHVYILDHYVALRESDDVKHTVEIIERYVANAKGNRPDVGCVVEFLRDAHGITVPNVFGTHFATTDDPQSPWSERITKKWGGETTPFMDAKESAFPGYVTPDGLRALIK